MATIKKFEDLEIWKLSREMSKNVYLLTFKDEFSKDFGLKDQIRRSSGSVMDNIAEGFGRGGNKEFTNFLTYSVASCNEVESQLYRAIDNEYISKEEFDFCYELCEKIISKTGSFIRYLNESNIKGIKYNNRVNELEIRYGNYEDEC
ncbi:MAG: four helix bundle protein [Bacteroidales bacterium]|nr:four helix bundle protein [Bacteroidales bacterium]